MWLRRFLRAGDFVAATLRPVGRFFKEWSEVFLGVGAIGGVIGAIVWFSWFVTTYQEEAAPAGVVKSAMAESSCLSNSVTKSLSENHLITRARIRHARNECDDAAKEAAALAEQLKLLPKKQDQVQPETVNRPATPAEIAAAAKADECVKATIPGWRRNIGGGPIMVNDLPEMRIACNNLQTLNSQLAAIPK